MERDALISHGATSCQKEKTFDHSDAYRTIFCKNCGTVPNINKVNLDVPCMKCGKTLYGLVSIPYSFKVLTHELAAGGILLSLKLKSKDKEIISE
jgi:DNA-directed RNA polymerase beta subunit